MHWTQMDIAFHAALASAGGLLVTFAQGAAPAAVAALWQGTAIAFILASCFRIAPRMSAAQRFAVWAAGFAVIVGLPFLPALARGSAGGLAVHAPLSASGPAPWFELDDRWALAIAVLWLVASLARAASLAVHSLRLRRVWNSASPVKAEANLRALLAGASPTRSRVEVCTTRALDRPSVIGFFAPRILIPEWLFARLTAAELEQVILHEAEHLRRRDDWTNLVQKLALVLFPLNPALMWIERRLCLEREMACDEGVVGRTQAPRDYAACLASLAERSLERRRAHALSLGVFERRPELVRRVSSILARKQSIHPLAARVLVGVVGCVLLVGAVELARCPQMVAFVPTAQQIQAAQTGAAAAPSHAFVQPTVESRGSGFRAIETKAMLPALRGTATAERISLRRAVASSAGVSQRAIASADATTPREVLLRADMPDADPVANGRHSDFDFAGAEQVVVLAAWEEVQSPPRQSGLISDFDADRNAQSQTVLADDRNNKHPAIQVTVTRVIFAVYPIDTRLAGPTSKVCALGPKPTRSTGSDSCHPPAPISESGWLVLQL